nr:leucine-rich repeat domain-containing protein [Clostridiales bacterium]
DCSVVLFFATLNSRESAYIRENELPWASKYGKPVIQCLLDAGTDMGLPDSTFAASVSQAEIETALSATDGIARGEQRTAKGISVLVNPADRYEAYDAKGSALSLYAAESEASARAILLEIKNSGCVFYESGGRGTEERLLRRCASLVVFLDRAFLRDQGLMKILTWAWQSGKDLAVCQLEGIEEEELPEELSGLHKMQWLDFSHGITGDMIKKLVRHLEKRGCRNTSAMPGFEYEKTKKGIVLKRYTGREAAPWIESAYGGIPVTEIADEAFRNCRYLQSIRIPDTVEKIGEQAFEECTNLSSLVFGSGLVELGRRSFCGCTSLTSVTLPEGIKKIGEGAFAGCSGLTSIDLPESVKTICGYAFSGCSGLKAFHFPNGVKRIETAVFNECKALTTVTLPEDTRSIEGEAFRLCDSLTSVVLPDGAGSIGTEAFLGCENLVSVHIPASVRWIDERAFYGCRNLAVTCPERSYALKYCMEHSIPVRKVKVRFLERLFPGKRR